MEEILGGFAAAGLTRGWGLIVARRFQIALCILQIQLGIYAPKQFKVSEFLAEYLFLEIQLPLFRRELSLLGLESILHYRTLWYCIVSATSQAASRRLRGYLAGASCLLRPRVVASRLHMTTGSSSNISPISCVKDPNLMPARKPRM